MKVMKQKKTFQVEVEGRGGGLGALMVLWESGAVGTKKGRLQMGQGLAL